ncbi:hypothetical protein A2U01_0059835, partial [Trifolium medium]|nr:hypothetical protein [Trifolium medium]
VFAQFCTGSVEDKFDSDVERDSSEASEADASLQVLGLQKSALQSLTTSGSDVFGI